MLLLLNHAKLDKFTERVVLHYISSGFS